MDNSNSDKNDSEIDETLFKDVKYYVSGELNEKIMEVLRLGGAERMNYFSDYVTHLVCGSEPDENDLTDANDVYEIPIVTGRWVLTCARLKKKTGVKGFKYDQNSLFYGMVFTFSGIGEDNDAMWSLITYNGGMVKLNFDATVTHLLTGNTKSEKYVKALEIGERIRVVTPDWVVESIKNKILSPYDIFHPKLLTWPKPRESTALITGFEQDDSEKQSDIPETESTQALLEKLKQRMPWNQPTATTPVAEPVKRTTWSQNAPQNTPTTTAFYNNTQSTENKPRLPWNPENAPATPQPIRPQPSPTPSFMPQSPQNRFPQPNQPQLPQNQISNYKLPQTIPNRMPQSPHAVQPQQFQLQQQQPEHFSPRTPINSFPNQQVQVQGQQLNYVNAQAQHQFLVQNKLGQRAQIHPQQWRQQLLQQQLSQQLNQQQVNQQQLNEQRLGQQQGQIGLQQRQIVQQLEVQQQQMGVQQAVQPDLGQQPLTGQQIGVQQQVAGTQPLPGGQPQLQAGQQQLQGGGQQLQGSQQQLQGGQQQLQAGQQLPGQPQLGVQPQVQLGQQIGGQQIGGQQIGGKQIGNQQVNPQIQQQQQQQLQQQQIQQQQLQQQLLNQQLGNQHLTQQQLAQKLNIQQQLGNQLNQQHLTGPQTLGQQGMGQQPIGQQGLGQQQLNPQQLGQQQLGQQPLNQQQLGQQQLGQQPLNQPQLGQQQLNPQQLLNINQQQFQQKQIVQQQIGQNQLVQQQLTQQQLNQQQLAPNQLPQPQINQPQLNQLSPQQITQQQLLQQQLQLNNQQQIPQQQIQLQQINQQQITQQQLVQQRHTSPQIGAPRLNWSPNQPQGVIPQRQYIQLDAQTHQQLQQMDSQQRAAFIAKLQKQRQFYLTKQAMAQQQQRGGPIIIRGGAMPPGLTPQQQMQLLQQQGAKPHTVVMQQQGVVPAQHAPGLSPIAQQTPPVINDQIQQMQIQRQQLQRLQQLQLQREQAQKQQPQIQNPTATPVPRPPLAPQTPQPVEAAPVVVQNADPQVVNAKTKTALANMLSIRLQSGSGNIPAVPEGEPSAAGTLRMMTAQHNAAMNPNARSQELIAMQQRRALGNITNGDMVRPPPSPQVATTPGNEPQKQQFSPGRALPPAPQRHGPFYGHNPNLKLPPDLFLLGCIFVVVEVERYLEETSPDWREVIERHGGEIEPVYCSRVTHVLCETQRHGVVMQALRDFKRCVTLYWLNDVVRRKQVVPPWQALHLPTGYIDAAPASRHLISLSGFEGNDRNRVVGMIKYTGAKYTSYFSRHNTVLVCYKPEGYKYQHAKKWNIPIVNVQWLTDLMLGNSQALNQIDSPKYQQFPQPVQFGFDPALVPNLMFAWKMPINISQESYERVKRSASTGIVTSKPKKPKLESPEPMQTDETVSEPPIIIKTENSTTHCVMLSFIPPKDRKELEKIIINLGGCVATSIRQSTHLVLPHLARTPKLINAITLGIKIVPKEWLHQCEAERQFLPENAFQFDAKDFNNTFKCDFYKSLTTPNRDGLFGNKTFFITPSVTQNLCMKTMEFKEMIELAGGVVEKKRRTLPQMEAANATVPYSYVVLTAQNDLHLVYDCVRNRNHKFVASGECIFNSILNQCVKIDEYLVKVED